MKKILSILIIIVIIVTICSGCANKRQEVREETPKKYETKIKYLEGTLKDKEYSYQIVSKGKYFIFSCNTSDEYIMFLDELDENIYEIVDIQLEHFSDANFFVTYKIK